MSSLISRKIIICNCIEYEDDLIQYMYGKLGSVNTLIELPCILCICKCWLEQLFLTFSQSYYTPWTWPNSDTIVWWNLNAIAQLIKPVCKPSISFWYKSTYDICQKWITKWYVRLFSTSVLMFVEDSQTVHVYVYKNHFLSFKSNFSSPCPIITISIVCLFYRARDIPAHNWHKWIN